MKPDTRSVVRVVAIAVVVIGAAVLVATIARALLLLFAGVLVALTLRSAAEFAARTTRASYGACLGVIVAMLLATTTIGFIVAAPQLYEQASALARDLPGALRVAAESLRRTPIGGAVELTPPRAHVAAATRDVLSVSLEAAGALVVVFFIGFFGAAQPALYGKTALALFPADLRPRIALMLAAVRVKLTRWLIGRIVAMIFMGVTAWIAFALLKLPLAAFLALLTGLLAFVEYAGAVAAAVPPIVLAFAESPKKALLVALVYTVLHVIEGYILTPLLARAAVKVPPAIVLAGQVVLGAAVGVLGLTFSTPLLVVGIAAVETLRAREVEAEPRPSRARLSLA